LNDPSNLEKSMFALNLLQVCFQIEKRNDSFRSAMQDYVVTCPKQLNATACPNIPACSNRFLLYGLELD
jgi:hypothetical protein